MRKPAALMPLPPQHDPSRGMALALAGFHFAPHFIIARVPELVPCPAVPFQLKFLPSAFVPGLSNDVTTCDRAIDVKC